MNLSHFHKALTENAYFQSKTEILGHPSLIGYEKKFRWNTFTNLHSYIIVTDFGETEITLDTLATHTKEAQEILPEKYSGYMGLITIILASKVSDEIKNICLSLKIPEELKIAFTNSSQMVNLDDGLTAIPQAPIFFVPVTINTKTKEIFRFKKKPLVGRIHYSRFKKILDKLLHF